MQIKKFDGKNYRGPYRDFPNKAEAQKAANELRESHNGSLLVRIQKVRDMGIHSKLYYYVLWLRSKARKD